MDRIARGTTRATAGTGGRVGARPLPWRSGPLFVLLVSLGLLSVLYADGGAFTAAVALTAVGAAFSACAALAPRLVPVVPPGRVRTALRDRERRTSFLPQRDPDASGRIRPRAPGRPVATAA
ncbi:MULTISPECIES: DUF6412 domain-containing protein [Streptomyces]|uniref:DUF6412 domain-containing protein n=1 Tax=Streptomyces lichenis TaxID=2306967 RepID=A0ABT0I5K3_9ACTN|nr:DUF6412 domain-containing protein [Streptomyces lichenis]MCK8676613.1 DUF6412 domain-containing protein [Streptomyces lichenis]